MKITTKTIFMLVLLAVPAMCLAQPESCKVTFTGKDPTIIDFARAYCSQFDESTSFEKIALAALSKGTFKKGKVECVVDSKNGYVKYSSADQEEPETLEMCYWNCDNKNEKLVAVNTILPSPDSEYNESYLIFYRYNTKTGKMTLIEAPFDREPDPIDLVDQDKADRKTIEIVLGSHNEDANRLQPFFILPRTGKDIIYRMADPNAIPKQLQREGRLIWDGNGFCPEN